VAHRGQPTVVLAQTKKGYGMGHWGQGRMGSHQQKKLEDDALLASVFSELHKDQTAQPLDDAADRFAQDSEDPAGEEADPETPTPGSNVTIGLLRRRGLGMLRDLNDSNS